MSIVHKFVSHFKRMRNARRFGVKFFRRGTFKMPDQIRLGNCFTKLHTPAEHGALHDFVSCFIEDEYGLSSLPNQPSTILDIGANIGFFALAARTYFPSSTIHCYEPNPRIIPFLNQNLSLNGFKIYPEAVGAMNGHAFIQELGDSNQARTSQSCEGASKISQSSLELAVERLGGKVDLAKIDCEGAEWEMFTSPMPWKSIRYLRMEYHLWGKHDFSQVRDNLKNLGFIITHHTPSEGWGIIWATNNQ